MASGLSVRFGENKLFAEVGEKTFLQRVLDVTDGIFAKRVVVTRTVEAEAYCLEKHIDVIMHSFANRNDTVRLGTEFMLDMDGILFCPCDQPLLKKESLLRMKEVFDSENGSILRLAFGEKAGAPVLFDKKYFDELRNLPEKKGGSYLIGKYKKQVIHVGGCDAWELFDVDTPQDLDEIKRHEK